MVQMTRERVSQRIGGSTLPTAAATAPAAVSVATSRRNVRSPPRQPYRRQHRHRSAGYVVSRKIFGLLRVVLLSGTIPMLFLVRSHYYVRNQHQNALNKRNEVSESTSNTMNETITTGLRSSATVRQPDSLLLDVSEEQENDGNHILPEELERRDRLMDFLSSDALLSRTGTTVDQADDAWLQEYSDVAELHHCNVSAVPLDEVVNWALPVVTQTVDEWTQQPGVAEEDVEREVVLELWEMYLTTMGACRFQDYRPTVPAVVSAVAQEQLQSLEQQQDFIVADDNDEAKSTRLVIVIVAYQDVQQLVRLVESVHLPQHLIVIHCERQRTTTTSAKSFVEQVQEEIVDHYDNVLLLEFGTVVYKTDSVSLINLRIMRWLVYDVGWQYDYHVTLDGSAYSLYNAHDLAVAIRRANRPVWLGALTHQGHSLANTTQSDLLGKYKKRVVLTTPQRSHYPKLMKRIARNSLFASSPDDPAADYNHQLLAEEASIHKPPLVLSNDIVEHMRFKSVSGNQGIYRYDTVQRLLVSPSVMELFGLSKYACCCCLEERNWIAALSMVGLAQEALEQASMFQVWGGQSEDCQGSMNNAVLSRNASLCYRLEDATRPQPAPLYMYGNETWDYLVDARQRGMFFARKFQSDNPESMELLHDIQSQFHQT